MIPSAIVGHLLDAGYDAEITDDSSCLKVTFSAGGRQLTIVHEFPKRVEGIPHFSLLDAPSYGPLAHVLVNGDSRVGSICPNDTDSTSVNFEVPKLAYAGSVSLHVNLISKLVEDPDWNRAELLREFQTNWNIFCSRAKPSSPIVFLAAEDCRPQKLSLRKPVKGRKFGLAGRYLAISEGTRDKRLDALLSIASWEKRQSVGHAYMANVDTIEPPPANLEQLERWYLNQVARVGDNEFQAFAGKGSRDYWIFISADTGTGVACAGIRLRTKTKLPLPTTSEEIAAWKIEPVRIRALTSSAVLSRITGPVDLAEKSVLLVGCGSVGSELAQRLGSAGIGFITLSDDDVFAGENLCRHTLQLSDIDLPKSIGLAHQIWCRLPWTEVHAETKRLLDWAPQIESGKFDLVIVAIGAPTSERQFFRDLQDMSVAIPVINTWVEAAGTGGHATLDIPKTPGCLLCSYVDPKSGAPGLSSNLNFVKAGQEMLRNHGGCGDQYLPYSAVASSYTANIAADLAIRFLEGEVAESSKMSWKGSDRRAAEAGLLLTHRYHHFDRSLEVLPLLNRECDECTD